MYVATKRYELNLLDVYAWSLGAQTVICRAGQSGFDSGTTQEHETTLLL